MARTYTDDQRTQAQAIYEADGMAAAHERTGIPKGTLSTWCRKYGWHTHEPERTAAATEATRRRWEALRTTMADHSGDLAAKILELIEDSLDELAPRTPSDARALATAAAILLDKAELLAGHATSRTEATINDQRQVIADAEATGLRLVSNG